MRASPNSFRTSWVNLELASRSRGKKTRIWCAATAAMSTTSALVGQARAYVLRSPHSHAKIVSIDVKRARQSPGVLHILTGNDPAVLALGLQSAEACRASAATARRNSPRRSRCWRATACATSASRWRWSIAETLNEAKDAAELIEVEYEDLPSATTLEEAIAPGAPRSGTSAPTTSPSSTRPATRPRPRRPSPRPTTSSSIACGSTASPPRRWSRAAASPNTIRATTATRSAAPCRARTRCGAPWRRTCCAFRRPRSASSPTMSAAASA